MSKMPDEVQEMVARAETWCRQVRDHYHHHKRGAVLCEEALECDLALRCLAGGDGSAFVEIYDDADCATFYPGPYQEITFDKENEAVEWTVDRAARYRDVSYGDGHAPGDSTKARKELLEHFRTEGKDRYHE